MSYSKAPGFWVPERKLCSGSSNTKHTDIFVISFEEMGCFMESEKVWRVGIQSTIRE